MSARAEANYRVMPRGKAIRRTARSLPRRERLVPVVPPDPALLSTDLATWAGEQVARNGRKYALMSRVLSLRLNAEGNLLEARVRGSGSTPYRVEVRAGDGLLAARCTCLFDWSPVCKHAVAAVEALRFPRAPLVARGGPGRHPSPPPGSPAAWALAREDRVAAARERELEERRQRARRERAEVRMVGGSRGRVRLEVARRDREPPCTVILRGERSERGTCTCPDFLKNELATCKHVERARAWLRRRPKPRSRKLLSVWWRPREWPARTPRPLQEIRLDGSDGEVPAGLEGYFDAEGWLREAPEGEAAPDFARRAVDAARGVARELRLAWDLDPLVETRIGEAAAQHTAREGRPDLPPGGEVWNDVVPSLGIRLHPYQEEGVAFLVRAGRAMLADDMGLGKTLQAIAAALVLRRGAGARKALVVCPASIKHQWRHEIARACGERAAVVEDLPEARLATYRSWRRGFLVLNYELVLRDIEAIRRARPDLVILDEAQRIKNWDTKTAMAVKRLESPHAFVLTGTPLENRLVELHSLVEFLSPRALGPRWRLLPFHAATDPSGRVLAYEDLDVLRARLAPFFLRRERSQVLDQLPDRTDNTFWTGLTPAQSRPYRIHAARIAALLARGSVLGPAEVRLVLQSLTSMRILCNAYAQYAWERVGARIAAQGAGAPDDPRALGSPKLEEFARVLEELLEQADGKILVFSQWERMLRLALHASRGPLSRRGERADVFHGGLTGKARARVLDAFRDDPDLRVLFSTDAGGLGLNFQESASVVVNLEVPWNPAVLEQRVGRVHRMGQRRSVQVLHFVTSGAIEERVRQVVEAKRALFDGLLVEEADRVVLDAEAGTIAERLRNLLG